jgi:2-polyprenyl-3-methyl-5-hydroxy-6-metoxy-1,4-benzoquinol methylase
MSLRKIARTLILPIDAIAAVFSGQTYETCLDVGAGTGLFLEKFHELGIIRKGIGVEVQKQYVRTISENMRIVSPENLGNERFDLIMFNDVLHHVKDKPAFVLGYLDKHLRNGGHVFIKEMNPSNPVFKWHNRFHDLLVSREIISEIGPDDCRIFLGEGYDLKAEGAKRIFLYDHYFMLFQKNEGI